MKQAAKTLDFATPLPLAIAVGDAATNAIDCVGWRASEPLPAGIDTDWLDLHGRPAMGEVLLVPARPRPRLLAALPPAPVARLDATRLGAALWRAGARLPAVNIDLASFTDVDPQGLAEGAWLASYRFDRHRVASSGKPPALARVSFSTCPGVDQALLRARVIAEAVCHARDLVNEPGSIATAVEIARRAQALGRRHGFAVEVWDRARLQRERFGGLLGVNRGSVAEPRFLVLRHTPAGATRTLALVGKGVTFDSGGLNTKNTRDMTRMKKDMAGAAAVIGAFTALRALHVREHVLGFVPLTDNMSGPDATRPGDVLRTRSGRTIEVLDTDCEGRLILADALAYACEQKPDLVVDVATLTGTVAIAIGRGTAALMGNHEALMARVQQSGARVGEPCWPFPLPDELRGDLRSGIADYRNNAELQGYTQIAAALLREFVTPGTPWAHLDMASPSLLEAPRHEHPAGATGWGVRLLLDFVAGEHAPPETPVTHTATVRQGAARGTRRAGRSKTA